MLIRNRFPLLTLIVAGTCLLIAPAQAQNKTDADAIVLNARIYTVNEKQPWAEALAIRDAKILAVGSAKDVEPYRGSATKVIDAKGHLVLPGFEDCHIHFMDGSLGLVQVNLNGASTVAEIQKRVKEYATSHPKEPWITGMGWTYPTFGPSALPNKKILDDVVPGRPVYLVAFDGHSSWANSKALAMAGITKQTPDPPNGKIVRDANGEATGALKESAGDVVANLMPKPTREERLAALRKGIHAANKFGLTRVQSAGQDFDYLDLYDELRRKGELSLRFYVAYFLNPPELRPEDLEKIEHARKTYHDDWIAGGVVKTMLDGVVETHTAAMLTPYSDDPSQIGKMFWEPAKYKAAVTELDRRGLQISANLYARDRREGGANSSGCVRGSGTNEPYARRPAPHRAYRDNQRGRYSTVWEAGCDRQCSAFALVSGCGHARHLGAERGSGASAEGMVIPQYSSGWRTAGVRQRLAGGYDESVDWYADWHHAEDFGR